MLRNTHSFSKNPNEAVPNLVMEVGYVIDELERDFNKQLSPDRKYDHCTIYCGQSITLENRTT